MRRSTVRFVAVFILALLGAPVAMHVVLHDLHGHHPAAASVEPGDAVEVHGHGDHEHPVVASPAPQVVRASRSVVPAAFEQVWIPAFVTSATPTARSVLAFGALRTDTDVGLQPLLSTFLI